jgi:hypothetical protein
MEMMSAPGMNVLEDKDQGDNIVIPISAAGARRVKSSASEKE